MATRASQTRRTGKLKARNARLPSPKKAGTKRASPQPARKVARRAAKPGRASTMDILQRASPREIRPPAKWRLHCRRLMDLREQLQRERGLLSEDARASGPQFGLHLADAGTDSYDRDMALGMLSSEQDALYEIEEALNRIRNGSYGICQLTGKRISSERLKAIPWTRFSAAAERQLEKEGAVTRTRLGSRENLPRYDTQSQVGEEQS